jgi:hypothetical protein
MHRAAAHASLSVAEDACGVRAILPRPEGQDLSRVWVKLKIASMESGNYAIVQVAEVLAKSGVKLVPDIVAGGGNGGATLVDVLLANIIRDGRSHTIGTAAG